MAENFYGTAEKAIGQLIRFENKDELKVTAVFENLPANSSQQFDYLRTWSDFVKENQWVNNWGNTDPASFVQLRKGRDVVKVESKINDFIYNYHKKDKYFDVELKLQPYTEKYMKSTLKNAYVDV